MFTAGNYVNYTYDSIGQLTQATGRESGGSTRLHEKLDYVYDAAGNLHYRTNNDLIQTFSVNSLNELSSVSRNSTMTVAGTTTSEASSVTVSGTGLSSGAATLYEDFTWARAGASPANGNNTYTAIASDSYGRSDTNSVTVYLPSSASYTYDDNGNLTSDGYRAFSYDDENQLITVLVTNDWKSEFEYDGKMRRRVRKEYSWTGSAWQQTDEVRYVYDRNLVVQERDGNNIPKITYTRGTDLSGTMEGAGGIGGLLARTENWKLNTENSANAHVLYHADGNGNITALASTNGILLGRYHYDPFGNTLSINGAAAEANLYRFSSKEYHPNSGLVYYLYRYYDSNLQRWINRDPLEESGSFLMRNRHSVPLGTEAQNLYTFVHNSPMNRSDPFGLDDRGFPLNGVVCNDCTSPGDYGTEVYVLINGQYFTLPTGKCTANSPFSGSVSDVDGVWICPAVGKCRFYSVKPNTSPFNACSKPPSNCPRWNGNPTSPNRPYVRSGHQQNNSPPSPKPPVYRPPSSTDPGSGR